MQFGRFLSGVICFSSRYPWKEQTNIHMVRISNPCEKIITTSIPQKIDKIGPNKNLKIMKTTVHMEMGKKRIVSIIKHRIEQRVYSRPEECVCSSCVWYFLKKIKSKKWGIFVKWRNNCLEIRLKIVCVCVFWIFLSNELGHLLCDLGQQPVAFSLTCPPTTKILCIITICNKF